MDFLLKNRMKIRYIQPFLEAVIISVNYSDILKISLEENQHIFDNIVIVTSSKDKNTQNLCKKYKNCKVVVTDCFYDNGSSFNKGKGINIGYENLIYKDWVVNLDSDIVLLKNFKQLFFNSKIDKEKLYWSKRIIFPEKKDWDLFLSTGKCNPPKSEEDAIGFLQIFNYNSKVFRLLKKYNNNKPYFEFSCDASNSDLFFKNKWQPTMRKMLKIPCYHLGEYEKNWAGRVTPEFK